MGATEAVDRLIPGGDTEEILAEERSQVEALCRRAQQALDDMGIGGIVVRPSGHGTIMTFASIISRRSQDDLVRKLEHLAGDVETAQRVHHNNDDA